MKKKAHELEFISQINRAGSGTTEVKEDYLKAMLENKLMKNDYFELTCLSLTEKTFIASGFNSFVVRLKPENSAICNSCGNIKLPIEIMCEDCLKEAKKFIKKS